MYAQTYVEGEATAAPWSWYTALKPLLNLCI